MSCEAAGARTWQAGAYTCTLTVARSRPRALLHAAIEWNPHRPPRLSAAELAQYRAGRNQALAELSHELGINAAVLEL